MDLHDLYTRCAADVHRFALYISGNPALADDLTSETFLRAWSSASPIREASARLMRPASAFRSANGSQPLPCSFATAIHRLGLFAG
jgi:DNA-directed RNA polymerase specialized sigma24 family protein